MNGIQMARWLLRLYGMPMGTNCSHWFPGPEQSYTVGRAGTPKPKPPIAPVSSTTLLTKTNEG